jgi:preprotein translocase subunit SecG
VYYVLLGLLVLVSFVLMAVVLLQSGKGGGLAAMGAAGAGSDTLFGGRQAATLLTKATWWLGGIFLGLSLTLSIIETRTTLRDPILRGEFQGGPAAAPAATPIVPGLGEPQPAPAPGDQPPPSSP